MAAETRGTDVSNAQASPVYPVGLSIIIVNWNTRDLLGKCLESVYEYPLERAFEVIVVDNASSDGSAEMVRQRFPRVRLIENGRNVGFAAANNQAVSIAGPGNVLLLNPDTEVEPGAIESLMRFMDSHPEAGAVGPRLLNPDGSLQVSCHPLPTLRRELWRLFHLDRIVPYAAYALSKWQCDAPQDVDTAQGACLLLCRKALEQVGLLDDGYFIYSEEVDLCRRLHQHGWGVSWLPEARVVHHGGQSTRQVAPEMFLQLYRAKVQYFRKHYGHLAAGVYRAILALASVARLASVPLLLGRPTEPRQARLSLAQRYWRLLRELPRI